MTDTKQPPKPADILRVHRLREAKVRAKLEALREDLIAKRNRAYHYAQGDEKAFTLLQNQVDAILAEIPKDPA